MDLPGFRLHPLNGDQAGYRAVRVPGDRRIVFRLGGDDARVVDLVDHHRGGANMPMTNPLIPACPCVTTAWNLLGRGVTGAAHKLGISRKQPPDVVNRRSGIFPEMAIRLDKVIGGGADTRYRLRSARELAQAKTTAHKIIVGRPAPVT